MVNYWMKIEIKSVSSNISFYSDAQIIYRWKKRDICMNIKRFIIDCANFAML